MDRTFKKNAYGCPYNRELPVLSWVGNELQLLSFQDSEICQPLLQLTLMSQPLIEWPLVSNLCIQWLLLFHLSNHWLQTCCWQLSWTVLVIIKYAQWVTAIKLWLCLEVYSPGYTSVYWSANVCGPPASLTDPPSLKQCPSSWSFSRLYIL